MTLKEWRSGDMAANALRQLMETEIFKHAMEAVEELSPAATSADLPGLVVGGGDFMFGRVQGWNSFKKQLKQLSETTVEVKQPTETYLGPKTK